MGTQYVSTTHPYIVRDANECEYDYIPVYRVKEQRDLKEKKKRRDKRNHVKPKGKRRRKRRGAKKYIHPYI